MTASAQDHAPLLERAFAFRPVEDSYPIEEIEGEVPDYIRGTYFVNGPALFQRGGQRYGHWLDGDGMVCALRFEAGRNGAAGPATEVSFANRFVRSDKFQAEEEADCALFRTFGTAFDGDRLERGIALASPVNVSVYPVAGTLLAFGEQGLPWALDDRTLKTRGLETFGRRLNPVSPFSAHPHVDPETGELFNFGVSFSARRPLLHLYRFAPPNGGVKTGAGAGSLDLVYRRRFELDAPRSVHDFSLSPSYAVFYLSPYFLDMERLLGDQATPMDALHWTPEAGTQLLLVRRQDGAEVARLDLGEAYCLHLIGCHETQGEAERNGTPGSPRVLTVDVIEMDEPVYDQYLVPDGLFPEARDARAVRYRIALGDEAEVLSRETLAYREMCDFPAVDPRLQGRDYGDFWVLGISASDRPGRKFFDRVVHLSWNEDHEDAWQAPAKHYLGGEPVFLGDPAAPPGPEGRGSVLCQCFDAEAGTSSFLLFDAFNVARGPVARLGLKHPIPPQFHAVFDPRE